MLFLPKLDGSLCPSTTLLSTRNPIVCTVSIPKPRPSSMARRAMILNRVMVNRQVSLPFYAVLCLFLSHFACLRVCESRPAPAPSGCLARVDKRDASFALRKFVTANCKCREKMAAKSRQGSKCPRCSDCSRVPPPFHPTSKFGHLSLEMRRNLIRACATA